MVVQSGAWIAKGTSGTYPNSGTRVVRSHPKHGRQVRAHTMHVTERLSSPDSASRSDASDYGTGAGAGTPCVASAAKSQCSGTCVHHCRDGASSPELRGPSLPLVVLQWLWQFTVVALAASRVFIAMEGRHYEPAGVACVHSYALGSGSAMDGQRTPASAVWRPYAEEDAVAGVTVVYQVSDVLERTRSDFQVSAAAAPSWRVANQTSVLASPGSVACRDVWWRRMLTYRRARCLYRRSSAR